MNLDYMDMSDTLGCFDQKITLSLKRTFTIDFEEFEECEETEIKAVVQPAQKEDLNVSQVDWSKSYVLIHSETELTINSEFVWNSTRYRIVSLGNFKDYGYYEAIGEEIK